VAIQRIVPKAGGWRSRRLAKMAAVSWLGHQQQSASVGELAQLWPLA